MTDNEYKFIVQKLTTDILNSQNALMEALQEELYQNINRIDFVDVMKVISDDYAKVITNVNLEGKKIAVICKGHPNITLQILLFALRNNVRVKLVTLNYHIINNYLYNIYENIMQYMKIPNVYFNYDENYLEQDMMKNNSNFDKIIYIGNYFDYENFEYFCDGENLMFWNDNNIKIFMPREEYKEEYKMIIKTCYINNVETEVYENEEEFFEEVQEGECALVYTTEENKQRFLDKLDARLIKFNNFNLNDFRFKINDLILALDFSKKM